MLWVLPTTVHLHVYYYKVLADFSNSCIAQSSRISCCEFQRMEVTQQHTNWNEYNIDSNTKEVSARDMLNEGINV